MKKLGPFAALLLLGCGSVSEPTVTAATLDGIEGTVPVGSTIDTTLRVELSADQADLTELELRLFRPDDRSMFQSESIERLAAGKTSVSWARPFTLYVPESGRYELVVIVRDAAGGEGWAAVEDIEVGRVR